MIDNKIIHNYLDSQIKCIDELMENHLLTLKKIFQIIVLLFLILRGRPLSFVL